MESIFALNLTVQLFPESAITHLQLGEAYKKAGDVEKAKAHFNSAIRFDQQGKIAKSAKKLLSDSGN